MANLSVNAGDYPISSFLGIESASTSGTSATTEATFDSRPDKVDSVPTRQDVARFNQYLRQPGISDAPKTVKELLANGFTKDEIMDMNGGVYYHNEMTGDTVRIGSFEKSYTYTHGRVSHEQYDKGLYDGGMIRIKELDGSTTIYSYKNDSNGEKYLTSVTRYE